MKEEQRWKRLRQLDKYLRRNGLYSQSEFAHQYDVDVRTIHNDLRWLEENAGPITPGKKRKQYIDKECPSPFALTEEQTIAYLIGYTSIHQYGGSAFEQDAKELHNLLLTKIADPVIRETLDSMSDAVKLRKGHITGDTERSAMHTLFTAYLNKQKVQVRHTKPGEPSIERVLHPYTFVNEAGEWSIIAYCELKSQIQRFKINRLEFLKLVDDIFVKDPEFEANDFLNKGFDNFVDGKSHRYRILFDPETTPHVANRSHHETQMFTQYSDGSCEIAFESEGLLAVARWVMQYGNGATVLEPVELLEFIRLEVEGMHKKYC